MYLARLFISLVLPLLAFATTDNYTVPLLTPGLFPLVPDFSGILLASSAPLGTEIIGLTIAGSGCPDGTAYAAGRNESLAVYTPRLTATSGPDESATDGRRFCQVVLDAKMPVGWQMGLRVAESSGYVSIGKNEDGQVVGTTWFSGVGKQTTWGDRLVGPRHDKWSSGFMNIAEHGVWSECGKEALMNVKLEVRLPGGMTFPSLILLEWTNLYLRWQEC